MMILSSNLGRVLAMIVRPRLEMHVIINKMVAEPEYSHAQGLFLFGKVS